jgi:hypothetical protein
MSNCLERKRQRVLSIHLDRDALVGSKETNSDEIPPEENLIHYIAKRGGAKIVNVGLESSLVSPRFTFDLLQSYSDHESAR